MNTQKQETRTADQRATIPPSPREERTMRAFEEAVRRVGEDQARLVNTSAHWHR